MKGLSDYIEFLKSKAPIVQDEGFEPPSECPEWFHPHQRDAAQWAIRKGRCAVFKSFGMGKSLVQLQWCKWVHEYTGGLTLIVAPLGVRQEFTRNDGPKLAMDIAYCRTNEEILFASQRTPYIITNYERVRDGDIDVGQFEGVTLDEASCLRSFGTKTTQVFTDMLSIVPYRMVATATPAPNAKNEVDYLELINYAHFLGVCDRGQLLTRFFGRDSKKAGKLTLYPHEQERFWLWVASWALFISKPSDLGYPDDGFNLPPLKVHWHKVETDLKRAWSEADKRGQLKLIPDMGADIVTSSKERRATLRDRVAKAAEIIANADPDKHWIIWHYLEDERHEIKKYLPEAVSVYGSQDLEEREDAIVGFSNGEYRILSTKPEIAGSGCNFQRYCSDAVFIAPTDRFNDFIQAVHRIYRFLQTKEVNIHVVFADTQDGTVTIMRKKWAQHDQLQSRMSNLVRQYGLSHEALEMKLTRSLNKGRNSVVVEDEKFKLVNNDCVAECMLMADDSIDQIVTSIPFGDHYEYSPSMNDFGHNMGDEPFFEQMDFLIPHLYRILKPGRVACIHVKDRITYGNMTGQKMYGVNEFSDKTVRAFKGQLAIAQERLAYLEKELNLAQKAGDTDIASAIATLINKLNAKLPEIEQSSFHYMGRIVIDTDVVRENAQTYRLGWTENSKDSTKMGCGSLEYVLLFRKWAPEMSPEGNANGPEPVTKKRSPEQFKKVPNPKYAEQKDLAIWWNIATPDERYEYIDAGGWQPPLIETSDDIYECRANVAAVPETIEVPDDREVYSRAKWQIQASGIWKDSGDEILSPAQLSSMGTSALYHFWRDYCAKNGYNYDRHLELTENADTEGILPASWMLFAPISNHPDIWTDIDRIDTLNTELARKTTESHLCPLQLSVIKRLVERFSNPGDTILDPFNGVGSTVYQSIKMGRRGIGIELNPTYWQFSVGFCEQAARDRNAPTLFDLIDFQQAQAVAESA